MKVLLNQYSDIKNVCELCSKFSDDVYATSGKFRVNAKSLLGLLSLDLSKEIDLVIDTYRDGVIMDFRNKVNDVLQRS